MQILKCESLKMIKEKQKKRYIAYAEKMKQLKENKTKEGK